MDITPRNYKEKTETTKNIALCQAGKTTNHRFLVRFVVSAMILLSLGLNCCGNTVATTMLLKNHRQVTTTKMITMITATTIMRFFSHSHRLFATSSTFSTSSFNPRRHRTTISYHDTYSYDFIRGGCSQHYSRQQQPQKLQKSHYYSTETTTKKQQPKRGINRDDDNNDKRHKRYKRPNKISKMIRQGTGTMFSVAGFFGSSFISFVTDRRSFQDRFVEPIEALNKFLKTSG